MNFNGSESIPDLNLATFLAFDDNAVPIKDSWIAEWRYPSGVVTRRIANRQGHTNIIFKMELDPVPAGDPCPICWGLNKPFGPGQTPESVTVVIANVKKGPGWQPSDGEPPDGAFILDQTSGLPCNFFFFDASFFIIFVTDASISSLVIFTTDLTVFIFGSIGIQCQTFYENSLTDPFIGGTATVFVPPVT